MIRVVARPLLPSTAAPRADARARSAAVWRLAAALAGDVAGVPILASPRRRCRSCGATGHGKPELPAALAVGLHVSVSATDGVLAAAVSDEGPVGLDVESVRAVAAAPVAAVLLHPREAARGGTGPRALAMTWVRKEALLKATGHGLRIPPSSLELTAAHAVPALLAAPAELGVGPLDVRLADLTDVELAEVEDHVGAVAVLVRR